MCIYCYINTEHQDCKQNLFKSNKYFIWYCNIIKNAITRKLSKETYCEKHHIIPKSMKGSNRKFNIVKLYPREHFLLHWLLIKCLINPGDIYKMQIALHRMMGASEKLNKHIWSKWNYDIARKHLIEVNKIINSGNKNPMYGKNHTKDAKDKISKSNRGLKRSLEHKKAISDANKQKIISKETKEKIRIARLGIIFSDETREKMRKAQLNLQKIQCKYCGFSASPSNIKRWHDDKCKSLRY